MKKMIGPLMLVVALSLAVPPCVTTARAEGPSDGAETQQWWGVAGAVLCGGGGFLIRTNPAIGMNPYVLGATIGGCLLAALDVLTT